MDVLLLARVRFRRSVFAESLPSNGSIRHNIYAAIASFVFLVIYDPKLVRPILVSYTSLSLVHNILFSQMIGWLMNTELGSTWKETVFPNLRYSPSICLEKPRKAMASLIQNGRSRGRGSNRSAKQVKHLTSKFIDKPVRKNHY
jgi:hypothetical protein